MGPNKIYELIVTTINALRVAFTDTDKQALFTVLPFVINTDNGYANNCSMNSIYKHMMQMLDITRPAAESRLRRALKRLQDNVDQMTYQNIFMSKESDGTQEHPSQHDILYCVVEYVVNEIQKELSGPAKNEGSCDCEWEPDRSCESELAEEETREVGRCCEDTQQSPCMHDCQCESCCCQCEDSPQSGCESASKSHVERERADEWRPVCIDKEEPSSEPAICHTRYPFEDRDGITKKGIISHVLNQFQLPFICHTRETVIECLMCLIGDRGEAVEFTYCGMNPDFTFMDKVSLFFDILSFEVDLFAGLDKNELSEYFGKKTKFILMRPSRFMFRLANVVSRKHIDELIREGKYQ